MRHILTAIIGVLVMLQAAAQGSLTLSDGAVIKTTNATYITLNDMSVTNNGVFEHTVNSGGTLKLTGASNLSISGNGVMNIYRLFVEKAPGSLIQLQTNLNIASEIYFNTGGSINLNNNVIDLGTAANVWNETANTSIHSTGTGYIQAAGSLSSPWERNPGRLGAIITSSADLGHTIIRRRHRAVNTTSDGNSSILRSYEIIPTNNTGLNATLRLHYFDTELNEQEESTLEMWKNESSTWTNTGVSSRHTGYNYVEKTGVNELARFTLARNANTSPVITCPGNITVSTDEGQCTATVSLSGTNAATATGYPVPTITYKINDNVITSPYSFPGGTTTVTAIASNGVGADASCSFTVTVNISGGLEFTPPPSQTIALGNNCSIVIPDFIAELSAKYNCGNIRFEQTPAAGSILASGHNRTHTVTITAIDEGGTKNVKTVTLTAKDITPPVITAPPAVKWGNDPGQCGSAYVPLGTPVISDNCVVEVTSNRPEMFPIGTTIVTWTAIDAAGQKATATQSVVVDDTEWPHFRYVPEDVTLPYDPSNNYLISGAVALDNCGTVNVSYIITGATTRSGTGNYAGSQFNPGVSTITWMVTDAAGNREAFPAQTVVTIVSPAPPVSVTIPDAWAVKPGGEVNTLYIGYGPAAIGLTAQLSGGQAPFTFLWSTGATSQDAAVRFSQPGTYTVNVVVKDANGATATASKIIKVQDIRCGAKLEKVTVCEVKKSKGVTSCVRSTDVAALLQSGAKLGACAPAAATVNKVQTISPFQKLLSEEGITATVAPNPSSSYFGLTVSSNKSTAIKMRIIDLNGKVLESRDNIKPGASINVGERLHSGVYLIEIRQESQLKVLKVIRQ